MSKNKSFQQVWRHMDRERRRQAADTLCTSAEYAKERPHATAFLAVRMHLRPQFAAKLAPEKIAGYLVSMDSLDELLAATLLRAYLFTHQQPMLSMFLDELQIPHDKGVISAETVAAPSVEALQRATEKIRAAFDPAEVNIYLSSLLASDPETWANLKVEEPAAKE